jgi:hypothetical protein
MRLLILTAATVLALSGCGKNNQAATSQNADEGMTAESIVSNDVTAIDAVTGDAANMAADVDMNYGNLDQGDAELNSARPSKPSTAKPSRSRATPTESNSSAPATSNTTGNSE